MFAFMGVSSIYAADLCQLTEKTNIEKALVKWVYDGDTLLVTDIKGNNKRKIRIIGIDTPEVKHHQQKAQLYGAKARAELRVLLKEANYQIFLAFGKEKFDRYKRTLAHVYLADGTNISEWLLQRGFAKTLSIPPNVKHATCYKNVERKAQQQQLRLWKLKSNRLKTPQELKSHHKGYIRLKGKVLRIKRQKKTILLALENNGNKPIQLKINKKNMRYFKGIDLNRLVGQQVLVSGILKNKKKKRTIALNHSSQLERMTAIKTQKKAIVTSIKWSTEK